MRKSTTRRNKLGAFVMILLIAAYVAPLFITYAGAGTSILGDLPEVPGVPDNAVQYNKTDVTPVAAMEHVRAGEPALFLYRNMTMLMNCTQNCTVVFTVDPEMAPKILGLSVEPNQTMTLTMNMSDSPLLGERVMERTLNFYLGMEPNAGLQLSAQIRLHINQTKLNQELNRVVNISRLTWMYWNRTQAEWKHVESFMDQNGYLVCNTDHFSTWTVAELTDTVETAGSNWQIYAYIGAPVAVVALTASIFMYKRRRQPKSE